MIRRALQLPLRFHSSTLSFELLLPHWTGPAAVSVVVVVVSLKVHFTVRKYCIYYIARNTIEGRHFVTRDGGFARDLLQRALEIHYTAPAARAEASLLWRGVMCAGHGSGLILRRDLREWRDCSDAILWTLKLYSFIIGRRPTRDKIQINVNP